MPGDLRGHTPLAYRQELEVVDNHIQKVWFCLTLCDRRQSPPPACIGPNEQRLKEAWEARPQSQHAAKDWFDDEAPQRLKLSNTCFRRFWKAALHRGSKIFSESKMWLLTPLRMAARQAEVNWQC